VKRKAAAALGLFAALFFFLGISSASAQALTASPVAPQSVVRSAPPSAVTDTISVNPTAGEGAGSGAGLDINVTAPDLTAKGGGNVVILLLGVAVLSIVPSLLILLTCFPRILIILSMARNAVGLPAVPPNQVITGLALFLTLFVMGPTLSKVNEVALQPVLNEKMSVAEGVKAAQIPLRTFMLKYTREEELRLMLDAAEVKEPVKRDTVPMNALIPAFLLSELRTAFTIGFAIFLPFLIIDLVVAAVLQSLGLMMLPPTFVSLPFKVMLFVLAGGWTLIIESILGGF
jgi:flagellar biosynthetic protein FliP